MKEFLRRSGLFIIRAMLSLVGLMLVLILAVQLFLIVGINLLNIDRGTEFITGKVNEAITESGYSLSINNLNYDPIRGFTVYGVSVADAEGEFLSLDKLSLSFSILQSAYRSLDISITGGTLSLTRLPVSSLPKQDTNEDIAPFPVPNIYFRTINFSSLSFNNIILSEQIAGSAYSFSPSLRAVITLKDSINVDATLKPGMPDLAPHLPAPDKIDLMGNLIPETLALNLEKLSISAPHYALDANGTANLAQGGTVSLKADSKIDNLSDLTQEAFSSASANLVISGPLAKPSIDLSASVITKNLKERGLSDINLTVKTDALDENTSGDVSISSAFRNDPLILNAKLSYGDSQLRISDLKGSAPDLAISGNALYANGILNGTLSASASDLSRYDDLLNLKLAGKLDVIASFSELKANQSANIKATLINGAYEGMKVQNLSITAALDNIANPWPQTATLDAKNLQLTSTTVFNSIKANIAAAGNETYKLSINGNANIPDSLSFNGSTILSELTNPIPTARDINFILRSGPSSIKLGGLFTPEDMDLKLNTNNLRGSDIPYATPQQLDNVRINLDAAMTGSPSQPLTTLKSTIRNIGAGNYQGATINLSATHDGKQLNANLNGQGPGIRTLKGDINLPVALSLIPFNLGLNDTTPLTGSLITDINLAAVAPLFLPPTQSLSGRLDANGNIAGTISSPDISGTLKLSSVAFNDDQYGVVIENLNADSRFTQESLTLNSLSATDGKRGTLSGNGTLFYDGRKADMGLRLNEYNIPRTDLADGILSANLSLNGSADGLRLSGTTNIEEMRILIPESFQSSIPSLNIIENETSSGSSLLESLSLDIKIDARNQVFVQGWGLDAEFGGDIAITGAASAPQLNGTLSSRRGRFEEFGKRFTLTRANLRFQGSIPPSPYLDIEATIPAGDVTGSIVFTGSAQKPSIAFSSTPALPQDEVLSRILFGKEATKISPFQAVQLAQTIQRYSGKGGSGSGFDPLSTLKSITGLDDISTETDESGATNVEVGKYLTDKVYLELNKGKAENSGAATIQIEMTPSINIESEIGQDAQGGGGIFWKHDY